MAHSILAGRGQVGWLTLGGLAALCVVAFAAPAQVAPGAIGAETCATCHDEVVTAFDDTAHGRAQWQGDCASCHGAVAAHAESGDPDLITSPTEMSVRAVGGTCLSCHSGRELDFWHASTHASYDVSCTSCHHVHQPWQADRALVNRDVTELCLSCHRDQRKHLLQRSRHPLREGLMSCVDCHAPHGTPAQGPVREASVNEQCYTCHAETRGPFMWEHAPVRENCLTCHDPHGANERSMLVKSAPRLCQSCHLFGHHQTVPGQADQVWNTNKSCVNCHHNIHGSNHPSGVIFMQ